MVKDPFNVVYSLEYSRNSYVLVEKSMGTIDMDYIATTNENNGVGVGNTIDDAIKSLVNSIHNTALEIEKARKKYILGVQNESL